MSARRWILLAFVALPLFAAALASPEVRRWLRGTGSIRQTLSNAGVGALFLVGQLVLRGALIGVFALVANLIPWKLPDSPWRFVLAFVLLDFVYYLQHRAEHRVPVLWAIHSVHHQSHDYNLSVSLRVGALASVSTSIFHSALCLAGVDVETYAAVATVHAAILFTLHARTKFTLGPGRFFNAPVFHRVHHGADTEYVDKNFGGVFLVFDRLFGTFAPYRAEPKFGVTGEENVHNPVLANVAPFARLRDRMRSKASLVAKLKVLFVQDS